jgi:hypothetical protein
LLLGSPSSSRNTRSSSESNYFIAGSLHKPMLVINGVLAPPLLILIMFVSNNKGVWGSGPTPGGSTCSAG